VPFILQRRKCRSRNKVPLVHWFLWLALVASFLCGCLGDMGLVSDTEWEHTLQSTELENNWLALHPRAGEGGLGALCLSVRVYTGKQISDFFFLNRGKFNARNWLFRKCQESPRQWSIGPRDWQRRRKPWSYEKLGWGQLASVGITEGRQSPALTSLSPFQCLTGSTQPERHQQGNALSGISHPVIQGRAIKG
jgi:hypothetical protein